MLLDLLLPALCPLCRAAEGPLLCPACREQLPAVAEPCPWCACPGGARGCPDCAGGGLPHIDAACAALVYVEPVTALIGAAKAEGRPAAVRAAAAFMPALPADWRDAVVVPVPPAPGRRPGPHLASACAQALARRERRPCLQALRQVRPAAPQHLLGAEERRRNVEGLFACRGPAPQRAVLVDDLCTSGATASAAAAALRAAGTQRILLVVLARTPRQGW